MVSPASSLTSCCKSIPLYFSGFGKNINVHNESPPPSSVITILNSPPAVSMAMEPSQLKIQDVFHRILPIIKWQLANKKVVVDLTDLADNVLKMVANPAKYKEKSLQSYPSCQYWVEMPSDCSKINLLIRGLQIDHGANISAYDAFHYEIPFELTEDDITQFTYQSKVWKQLKPSLIHKNTISSIKQYSQVIKKGVDRHKEWVETLSSIEGVKLASLQREVFPWHQEMWTPDLENYIPSDVRDLFCVRVQEKYDGNLWNVIESKGVMVEDIDHLPSMHEIPLAGKLDIFLDIGKTLSIAYKKKLYVHQDIHPGNFLIKITPEGKAEGFLADFDKATHARARSEKESFSYWDRSTKKGWLTSFTDTYGLIISLGIAIIPNFEQIFEHTSSSFSTKSLETKKINTLLQYAQSVLTSLSISHQLTAFDDPKKLDLTPQINKLLDSFPNLPLEIKQRLEALPAEVQIIHAALVLVNKACVANDKLYALLSAQPDLQAVLKEGNEEDKRAVILGLEKTCFPSLNYILSVIQEMRNLL